MIWKALGDRGFSQYAYEVTDRDLHIILASFDDVDISEIIELFEVFLSDSRTLSLVFNHLSAFLGTCMVTLNPVKTLELAEFYQDLHDLLKEVVSDKSLYNTKNWAPRLTLVNRIWEELFSETFQYCLETFKSISGKITAIKLIRIEKITRLKPCLTIILSIKTAAKKVGCF